MFHKVFYRRAHEDFREILQPHVVVSAIPQTHVMVREVESKTLEDTYALMQGETWSPRGEQREFIASLGLDHTSMMAGDVVLDQTGNYHLCLFDGWSLLSDSPGLTSTPVPVEYVFTEDVKFKSRTHDYIFITSNEFDFDRRLVTGSRAPDISIL